MLARTAVQHNVHLSGLYKKGGSDILLYTCSWPMRYQLGSLTAFRERTALILQLTPSDPIRPTCYGRRRGDNNQKAVQKQIFPTIAGPT